MARYVEKDRRPSAEEISLPSAQTALARRDAATSHDLAAMETKNDKFLSLGQSKGGYVLARNAGLRGIDLNGDYRISLNQLLSTNAECPIGKN